MSNSVDSVSDAQTHHRRGFWRRYGLSLYWLLFALYTIAAAREPGFVRDREHAPYPWVGLVGTWAVLALETGLLSWILRPRSFHRSWGRVAAALILYIALAALTVLTSATDMPGYYYVPGMFHFVTLIGLVILALVVATRSHRLRSD